VNCIVNLAHLGYGCRFDLVTIHRAIIHRATNNRGHLTGRLITGAINNRVQFHR